MQDEAVYMQYENLKERRALNSRCKGFLLEYRFIRIKFSSMYLKIYLVEFVLRVECHLRNNYS